MVTVRTGAIFFWILVLISMLFVYKIANLSIIALVLGYIIILLVVNILNPYEWVFSAVIGTILFFAGMFSPLYGALLEAFGSLISFVGPIIAALLQFFNIHIGAFMSFSISQLPAYVIWGLIGLLQLVRHVYGRNNFGVFSSVRAFFSFLGRKEVLIDILITVGVSVLFLQFSDAGNQMVQLVNQITSFVGSI
jgi:hypothetical protein